MSKKMLTPLNLLTRASDPSSGTEGDMYFNTVDQSIRIYNGSTWVTIIKSTDPIPFYEHTHEYDGDVANIFPVPLDLASLNNNDILDVDGGLVTVSQTLQPGFSNSAILDGGIVSGS